MAPLVLTGSEGKVVDSAGDRYYLGGVAGKPGEGMLMTPHGVITDRDIVCKGLAKDSFDASRATARDVMTAGIHCCREDDDLAKAVRHMEELKIRRLPVINKSKRMVGILSLGDVSHSAAPGNLLSEWVRSVSAHH